jgi:hypothetical protein
VATYSLPHDFRGRPNLYLSNYHGVRGNGSRKRGKIAKEVRSGVGGGVEYMNGETEGLLRHQLALHQQTIILFSE